MYRIHQIKLGLDEEKSKIPDKILKKIGGRDLLIKKWEIVKESIDARDKSNICRVYSVDFTAVSKRNPKKECVLALGGKAKLEQPPDITYHPVLTGEKADNLSTRPIVVGLGPAGLFCGLILAQAGYNPLIIERGHDVDRRKADVDLFWSEGVLDEESNVQFGEGGAGTFSDGKLTTGIKDTRIRKVLEEMVAAGAPNEILYRQKPHIGTDILRTVVKNIRKEIIRLGGQVEFGTRLEDILLTEEPLGSGLAEENQRKRVRGIVVSRQAEGSDQPRITEEIPAQVLILAVGHSARDTFRMLKERHIAMSQKPFSIGVRIEHPQDIIDIAQYGRPARELGLPVADYKLNYRCKGERGRGVYTFCMCPGGQVIGASSQKGGVVTNGMSYHERNSGTANSALLCDVRTEDFESSDVLAGVYLQEKYERLAFQWGGSTYRPPQSTWGELRDGKAPHVEACLPEFAIEAFREAMPNLGKKLRGFDATDAKITAVEARSSSPIRIFRGDNGEGSMACNWQEDSQGDNPIESGVNNQKINQTGNIRVQGFYPCGEGAGYAGGITSAAVDGIKTAEKVIEAYKKNTIRTS